MASLFLTTTFSRLILDSSKSLAGDGNPADIPSSINKLFKETDYNLNDVRQKKLVKPVALTLLPNELKMIESMTKILEE